MLFTIAVWIGSVMAFIAVADVCRSMYYTRKKRSNEKGLIWVVED